MLNGEQRSGIAESETAMAASPLSHLPSPISLSTVDAHVVGSVEGAFKSYFLSLHEALFCSQTQMKRSSERVQVSICKEDNPISRQSERITKESIASARNYSENERECGGERLISGSNGDAYCHCEV
ncbi:hypothetical protein CK203_014194 [Vitis vinifera]|uniref:Uncharacterized protein n=1 Tax=Vitis vinifera TaxID=29760 RepID=A0A438JHS4_VITVI|nr:hypothetical protein CK203_014194 [Vitis vinifera]